MPQIVYIGSEELNVALATDIPEDSDLNETDAVYTDYELTASEGVTWTDETVRVYSGGLCVFLGSPSVFTFSNSVEIATLPSGALPTAYSKLAAVMSTDSSSNYGVVITVGTSGTVRVQLQNSVGDPSGTTARIEGMPTYVGGN